MYISCGYLYAQNESMPVTGSMGFVGKLSLMLPFYKHSAVRIRGGYRLFYDILRPTTALRRLLVVVVLIFNRLLSQLFTLCIYFSSQLAGINLCCLGNLFLLELLFICAGFDMGSVNEYCTGIQHPVIQRFVEDMLKDFRCQLIWKTLTEGIADCSKMGNCIQQTVAQKPAVYQIYLNFPICLAQGGYPEQMLNEHHFYENNRACSRSAIVMAVVWLQPLIQSVVVHDFLNLTQQMFCRNQGIYVNNNGFLPHIFSPLFHKNAPFCDYYITNEGLLVVF